MKYHHGDVAKCGAQILTLPGSNGSQAEGGVHLYYIQESYCIFAQNNESSRSSDLSVSRDMDRVSDGFLKDP